MANYELMMILNPEAGEKELTSSIETIEKLLKAQKAKGIKKDVWGDKKLAYKINGSETGHYVLWTLELDGTAIKGLNTEFNLEANIWRYMFVNLED